MAELYNIFVRPRIGVSREDIEKKLDLALDWFRYADGGYLVYSTTNTANWAARLMPLVQDGGNLLITIVDPEEYNGFMPKDIWPWLQKMKKKIYGDH